MRAGSHRPLLATLRNRLRADRRGAVAVEFALVASAFVVLLLGIVEYALFMYAETTLENAVAEAARFGITGRTLAGKTREQVVADIIQEKLTAPFDPELVQLDTLVYPDFSSIGRPEPFVDENGNGVRDPGEPYTDVNGNGEWDADMGESGLGGPDAVVLYRVRYPWQLFFPLFRAFFPPDGTVWMEAGIAVRNEPFPEN